MTEHLEERRKKHSTARSGEHPAVKAYRDKLDSIDKGGNAAMTELDQELQEFLDDLKTPVPPKRDD